MRTFVARTGLVAVSLTWAAVCLVGCPAPVFSIQGHYEGSWVGTADYLQGEPVCPITMTLAQSGTLMGGTIQFAHDCLLPEDLAGAVAVPTLKVPLRGSINRLGEMTFAFDPDEWPQEEIPFELHIDFEAQAHDADANGFAEAISGTFTFQWLASEVPGIGQIKGEATGTFNLDLAKAF